MQFIREGSDVGHDGKVALLKLVNVRCNTPSLRANRINTPVGPTAGNAEHSDNKQTRF